MSLEGEKNLDSSAKIEEWIQNMVPEVVLAVESLELATAERVRNCLEQKNIKATRSQTEMVLDYGCKKGVMEEKRRYRLNPELRSALNSASGSSKVNPDNTVLDKSGIKSREHDDRSYYNLMDCDSELSEDRPKSDSFNDDDYEEEDASNSEFENDDH